MNEEFGIDLEEIGRVIDEAEVFIVRFTKIDRRLLVDMRAAEGDPPLIRIVPRVSSAQERYRYLREARPAMDLPDQITVFSWPRDIQTMRAVGLWGRIEDRLVRSGGAALAASCAEAFNDVLAGERAEIVAAILGGEGFETLWERPRSR